MLLSRSEMEAWGALAKRALRLLRPAPKLSLCCQAPLTSHDPWGRYPVCADCGEPLRDGRPTPPPPPVLHEPGTPIRVSAWPQAPLPRVKYEAGGVFPSAARYYDPYTKQYLVGDVIVNAETLLGGVR